MKNTKRPQRDPIAAFQREATAARRIGVGKQCACGETRPEALITGSEPTLCAGCQRKAKGRNIMDNHHPAGEANHPATVPTPVNDHWAVLNTAQHDWPKETLENRDGCPLLKGAACVRGCIDYLHYLIDKFLAWIPEMLEKLSVFLGEKLGLNWWVNTPLQQFAPQR